MSNRHTWTLDDKLLQRALQQQKHQQSIQNHQPTRRIPNLNAARSSQPIPRIAPVPTQTVPQKNQKFSLSKDERTDSS
jgi:hypothetical protein